MRVAPAGVLAWLAVASALLAGALAVAALPPGAIAALDWRPGRALAEPWRSLTAAWVHWSLLHLVANVAGTLLVAALGASARVPPRVALAWLAAWPLVQAALAIEPALGRYGGLSGVLHAGTAAVGVHLLVAGDGGDDRGSGRRWIGAAILLALVVKVAVEAPWSGGPLRRPAGWDIAVAPLAHATGIVAGAALAAIGEATARLREAVGGIGRSTEARSRAQPVGPSPRPSSGQASDAR